MHRSANKQTLYWHDYETYGRNAQTDRAVQFAGLRTDENLNIISAPFVRYCKLSRDYIPHPAACLVHGISPQYANENGICESEFIREINEELSTPDTCALGFNSLEFDDEFTRNLLYRNLYDPYAREWKHGCSRWDIINIVRLTAALRPEGIVWPTKEDGKPTFRLEDLAQANGLGEGNAHDALGDVKTTIALAQLLRNKQGRLFKYCYTNRTQTWIKSQLDLIFRRPVMHVDKCYGAKNGYLAIIVPLAKHPTKDKGVIVYDLSADPEALLTLSSDEIHSRIFATRAELEERGVERIPLRTIMLNRYPVLAELHAMRDSDAERLGIDKAACLTNLNTIKTVKMIGTKLREVFSRELDDVELDPDLMLYRGDFLGRDERKLLESLHRIPFQKLGQEKPPFSDSRLPEMLFRYRARNAPETLSTEEQTKWRIFCQDRLRSDNPNFFSLDDFDTAMESLKERKFSESQETLLRDLTLYVDNLRTI